MIMFANQHLWFGCAGDEAEAAVRNSPHQFAGGWSWSKCDQDAERAGEADAWMLREVRLRADGSGQSASTLFGRIHSRAQ